MPGSRSSSAVTRLVLPPPDGAASTKRQPEAGGRAWCRVRSDARGRYDSARSTLRALRAVDESCCAVRRAPLDSRLRAARAEHESRRCGSLYARRRSAHSTFCTCSRICSISTLSSSDACDSSASTDFEPERVRLAMELLHQEVEALARAAAGGEHAPHFGHVRREPLHFLGHVDLGGEQRELLLQPLLVRVEPRLLEARPRACR